MDGNSSPSFIEVVPKVVADGKEEDNDAKNLENAFCVKVRDEKLVALTCRLPYLKIQELKETTSENSEHLSHSVEPRLFEYMFDKAFPAKDGEKNLIERLSNTCLELLKSNKDACLAMYGRTSAPYRSQ